MKPDPVAFVERTLIDPETGTFFVLTDAQRLFLRHALKIKSGRLAYPEIVFSAPKKSGKTGFAAMTMLYVVRGLGGPFAEGICCANDAEQSTGRVFQACARIVQASPMLRDDAIVLADKITFRSTGASIIAIASDAAGAAGANPSCVSFDELWGYTSERSRRLWDELVPPPTRKISCRLTTTYAGFEGESLLLADLHARGLSGTEIEPDLWVQPGMAMFWTNRFTAPWQTEEWREQMRQQLRPNAYLLLIESRWVTTESNFVEMDWWDSCVDPNARPLMADKSMAAWIGVDASVKHDSTAIVVVTWDARVNKPRLISHRKFQPTAAQPINFEATVEATLREYAQRFSVRAIVYDPYQMAATAQRLRAFGLPMREYPQTEANITQFSSTLFERIKAGELITYPDDAIRLAVSRAIAKETARGWKITKEKASHKIDVVVALAMAVQAAGAEGQFAAYVYLSDPVVRATDYLPTAAWTAAGGYFDPSAKTVRADASNAADTSAKINS
jgi:Terminase large subunit, endonuclease domain